MHGEMFVPALLMLLFASVTATESTETTTKATPTPPPPPSPPCGHPTVLNGTTGEILSPNYPNPYGANVICTWVIPQPASGVYITIEALSLDPNDQLRVYKGSKDGQLIALYSGTVGFGVIYSTSTTTLLLNSTNGAKSGSGAFKLMYTVKDCKVNVTSPAQVITSPVYLKAPGNLHCMYTISSTVSNKGMALTFSNFDVKKGELVLNDTSTTVRYNDSSATSVPDFLTKGQLLTMSMTLPTSSVQQFSAQYTLVDVCSEVVTLKEAVTLTNPSGAGNKDCRYLVQSPEGTTISALFANLNMMQDADYIQLNDGGSWGSPLIERLTKSNDIEDVPYLSSGNSLWLQYKSGPGNSLSTFSLILTPLVYGRRFSTPGPFELKASNSTRVPVIQANRIILYQFEATNLNSQVSLTFKQDALIFPTSHVTCFDGFSSQAKQIAYFNTSTQLRPVFSNGNRILMVLNGFTNPNGSLNAQHISGDFTSMANDGTMLNSMLSTGGFQLDLPVANVSEFTSTWLIHNYEMGEFVSLDLQTFDNVGERGNLSVYSSLSPGTAKPVAMVTSADTVLPLMYLPKARIEYSASNVTKAGIVYRGAFSTVDGCGRDLSAPSGRITTPMFPSQYPLNAACAWNISQAAMLHLSFTTFDLAPKHTVSLVVRTYHYYNHTVGNKTVTYRNSSDQVLRTLGGNNVPNDVIAKPGAGNELWVKFSSINNGALAVGQGVDMSYEAIDCGGNMTSVNFTLKNPGYPKPPSTTTTCVWIVSLPANNSVNASHNIVSFTVAGNGSRNLEIRDGPSINSEPIPLNASGTSKPILSRTNYLWVRYSYKAGQAVNAGGQSFSLSYTTHTCDRAHQCKNGLCLHDDWKCNGEDDCGDGTDEKGCVYGSQKNSGYAGWVLGLAIIATFVIAVALAILVPILYRRARTPNYSTLRDMSVDT